MSKNIKEYFSGKLISFEGCDGVGKTTQVQLFAKYLDEHDVDHIVVREPGGTPFAEQVRSWLKKFCSDDPMTKALILFASRRDLYDKVIHPALKSGKCVICDRFFDSTLTYQGVLEKADIEDLMTLKRIAIGDVEPDITFILDLDYCKTLNRIQNRDDDKDKYDLLTPHEFNVLRNGFLKCGEIFSYRACVIKANGPTGAIFHRIEKYIKEKLNQ